MNYRFDSEPRVSELYNQPEEVPMVSIRFYVGDDGHARMIGNLEYAYGPELAMRLALQFGFSGATVYASQGAWIAPGGPNGEGIVEIERSFVLEVVSHSDENVKPLAEALRVELGQQAVLVTVQELKASFLQEGI